MNSSMYVFFNGKCMLDFEYYKFVLNFFLNVLALLFLFGNAVCKSFILNVREFNGICSVCMRH